MPNHIAKPPARYLRDDSIRGGMDLLMFAHRSHLRRADEALANRGLGRAHHRALYFISRNPGRTVSDLLQTLAITKQSVGRVLQALVERELLEMRTGRRDRRTRELFLTVEGERLEADLFKELHANMARAYTAAGEAAVAGYWVLMQHLMDDDTHSDFLRFNKG